MKESQAIKQKFDLKTRCLDKPKLRTFVTFKDFDSKPSYLTIPMSFICRKYLALIRLSNLAIRIETGRFERPRIEENFRLCQVCLDGVSIENENHVIFKCTSYNNIRMSWLSKIKTPENFCDLAISEKLKVVLNWPENVKLTSQFLIDAFNKRSKIINN